MREKIFKVDTLIRLQQVIWYIILMYFAALAALFMLDFEGVLELAGYGIIFIIATTALRLVVMAEEFRKSGLRRFWALSYLLILILAGIVIGDYLL
ncbi:MAG: hypothetical protein JSW34_02400 [Candidatus Zixiibacteriota bacterium]|nr:MAG: hypothetical protein JSW34_02400 [candidate division Zixibacteria bacterium]